MEKTFPAGGGDVDIGDESSGGKTWKFPSCWAHTASHMRLPNVWWNYKSGPFAGQKKTDEAFSGQQPALLDTPSTYGNPTGRGDNSALGE